MTTQSEGILKHTMDRFGFVRVMDVAILDYSTKKLQLELDTLKISSFSIDGSNKEIRGGQTSDLLIDYNYGRTASFEIEDALVSAYSLASIWGSQVSNGVDDVIYHHTKDTQKVITGTDTIILGSDTELGVLVDPTIAKEHNGNLELFNKTKGTSLVEGTDYTLVVASEEVVSITLIGATIGDEIVIYGLAKAEVVTGDNAYVPNEVSLKSNGFPSAMTIVGKTVVIEESTGRQIYAEIEFPKVQVGSSTAFTLQSDGDASTFNFSGKMLTPEDKKLVKIKKIKYVTNVL